MKTLLSILVLLAITKGCNNMESDFIDKYGDADFSIFSGHTIYKPATPGFGRALPIFFIEDINNPLQIRYIVELNVNRNDIKEIRKEFIRDTIATDGIIGNKDHLKAMVLRFNEFNIYSIKVDSSKNIFVKQKAIEQDKQIVRFENSKTLDPNKWILIKGNWYREK